VIVEAALAAIVDLQRVDLGVARDAHDLQRVDPAIECRRDKTRAHRVAGELGFVVP
jgi:hypothetical protein